MHIAPLSIKIKQSLGKTSRIFSVDSQSTYNINKILSNNMENTILQAFNELIRAVSLDFQYKKIVAKAEKKYLIKRLNISTLNPQLVAKLIQRNFCRSFAVRMSHDFSTECLKQIVWALNEFKVFAWVSVCFAIVNNKQLENFDHYDYQFLYSLFPKKSPDFLEYHLKSFQKKYKNSGPQWSQQQTSMLIQVIDQQKKEGRGLIWSQVSLRLFIQSEKRYYRTPQKCRELWNNHLSPTVNRSKWTLEQDILLFQCIKAHCLKWASISKQFRGARTEHMIKNRYNSLLRKFSGRAQRYSQKRVLQKIWNELQTRLAKSKTEESLVDKEDPDRQYESKCLQVRESEILSEMATPNREEIEVSPITKPGFLNLEQLLLSGNSAFGIEEPAYFTSKMQLVEVEVGNDFTYGEEYLNSLLF